MEGLMTFTGLVMIAFGILQIILFFKMWGMTNDVRKVSDKFTGDSPKDLKKAILKEDKGRIAEILFDAMFNEMQCCYDDSFAHVDGEKDFIEQISNLKKEYKDKYLKYGINFPESIDKIEKREDIENL